MPAHRLLPDNATLRHWVEDEGLTHQQIADRVYQTTGQKVSRSSVSVAIHRSGLSATKNRYTEELPWRVKEQHMREYPARMLRLLGRRRRGAPLDEAEVGRLDSWFRKLEDDSATVVYDPTSRYGFYYVDREDGDWVDGIPIRRQEVRIQEV